MKGQTITFSKNGIVQASPLTIPDKITEIYPAINFYGTSSSTHSVKFLSLGGVSAGGSSDHIIASMMFLVRAVSLNTSGAVRGFYMHSILLN